jgi:hypothetical protein
MAGAESAAIAPARVTVVRALYSLVTAFLLGCITFYMIVCCFDDPRLGILCDRFVTKAEIT